MTQWTVGVATCAAAPDLDEDGAVLLAALSGAAMGPRPALWDDPKVDWAGFDGVLVRSTWDYPLRRDAFLAWARRARVIANPYDMLALARKRRARTCSPRGPVRLHHGAQRPDPPHGVLRAHLAPSAETGRPERRHHARPRAICGPTRTTGHGPQWTPSSAELRTLCGLTPTADRKSTAQRGATDESACTPGSVHGCLAASRWAVIHLGLPLPAGSSGLPAGSGGPPSNACAGRRRAAVPS